MNEKDELSAELRQSRTRILKLEQEKIRSDEEGNRTKVECISAFGRCLTVMGKAWAALASKREALEKLELRHQADAKEIVRLRALCGEM